MVDGDIHGDVCLDAGGPGPVLDGVEYIWHCSNIYNKATIRKEIKVKVRICFRTFLIVPEFVGKVHLGSGPVVRAF